MATKPPTRDQLMALPSFSSSLSTLPNATSFDGLALHANFTTTIQHTAASAAKVRVFVASILFSSHADLLLSCSAHSIPTHKEMVPHNLCLYPHLYVTILPNASIPF
jgi:hypothetical protein